MPNVLTRRRLSTLDKLKIVVRQARCPVCQEKLGTLETLDFDHEIALSRGGQDLLDNIRAIHRQPCHAIKTNGTKATTLGSDKHEKAKTDRLTDGQAQFRARLLAKDPGVPRQKSGKIRSRGFPKRHSAERRRP